MENENKKEILNVFRRNKASRNTAIVLLLVSLVCLCLGVIIDRRRTPTPENIENVQDANVYVEGKLTMLTDYFATYELDNSVTDKYYMAFGENSGYILILNNTQYKELCDRFDNGEEEISITGMSESVPSDLVKIAKDYYKEMAKEEGIEDIAYEDIFNTYLLNAKKGPNDSSNIFFVIGGISGWIGFIFIIVCVFRFFIIKSKVNKFAKKYDLGQLRMELESSTKVEYNKIKTILLDNFVISYATTPEILRYQDIAWFYPHEQRVNGVRSYICIMVVTKDRKNHMVAVLTNSGKEGTQQHNDIYNELIARCPNALCGYTSQNITAMSRKNFEETIKAMNEKENM